MERCYHLEYSLCTPEENKCTHIMVLHILKKQTGILQAQNVLHTPQTYKGLLVGASECCFRTANCRNELFVTSGLARTEGKEKSIKLRDPSPHKFRDSEKCPATPIKLQITKNEEETDRRNQILLYCQSATFQVSQITFFSVLWLLLEFC